MTPLAQNPIVVLHIEVDPKGFATVKAIGSNISPDLHLVVVNNAADFVAATRGVPFKEPVRMEAIPPVDIPV